MIAPLQQNSQRACQNSISGNMVNESNDLSSETSKPDTFFVINSDISN
jgi:hypothetical protein